jgi:hypothetical protein
MRGCHDVHGFARGDVGIDQRLEEESVRSILGRQPEDHRLTLLQNNRWESVEMGHAGLSKSVGLQVHEVSHNYLCSCEARIRSC